jgi:hypothetical protein
VREFVCPACGKASIRTTDNVVVQWEVDDALCLGFLDAPLLERWECEVAITDEAGRTTTERIRGGGRPVALVPVEQRTQVFAEASRERPRDRVLHSCSTGSHDRAAALDAPPSRAASAEAKRPEATPYLPIGVTLVGSRS